MQTNDRSALAKELANRFAAEVADVALERFLKMVRCCPNCFFFNKQLELCGCKNVNARPPARIIAFGCDEYMGTEEIPF